MDVSITYYIEDTYNVITGKLLGLIESKHFAALCAQHKTQPKIVESVKKLNTVDIDTVYSILDREKDPSKYRLVAIINDSEEVAPNDLFISAPINMVCGCIISPNSNKVEEFNFLDINNDWCSITDESGAV